MAARSTRRLALTLFSALALCAALAAPALAKPTTAPVLEAPVTGGASTTPLTVEYELAEEAAAGSVELEFIDEGTAAVTKVALEASEGQLGPHRLQLSLFALAGSPGVASTSSESLPDGDYEVRLSYQNVEFAPAASAQATEVEVKTTTQAPTAIEPVSGEVLDGPFEVEYSLPEAALPKSVALVFDGEAHGVQTIVLTNAEAGIHTVTIDPKAVMSTSGIASGPAELPADRYQLQVAYRDALGNPVATSPTGLKVRIVAAPLCSPGNYSATGESPCQPAPAGHYDEGEGATAPVPCPAGTYDELEGSSLQAACLEDEAGHYSSPGSAVQYECAEGTYAPSAESGACTPAAPGHYVATEGASSQSPCVAGSYAELPEASMCAFATPGHYVASEGASSQVECEAGTYSPASEATACDVDPPGHYSGAGSSQALLCGPGEFAAATHSARCTTASPGYYVPGTGASVQTPCAPGSYAESAGSFMCALATPGHHVATEGASSQAECEAGTYSLSAEATACTPASLGQYVGGPGASTQTPCAPGSYAAGTKSTACTPAPAGSYVASSGAYAPTACPTGSTSAAGAVACAAIPSTSPPSVAPTLAPSVIAVEITGPHKQASLLHTGKQLYDAYCRVAMKLVVRVTATVRHGKRQVVLSARATSLACAAGKAATGTATFKLTKAARKLLAGRHCEIALSVSAYGNGELMTRKSLLGKR